MRTSLQDNTNAVGRGEPFRRIVAPCAVVFLLSYILLFLGMSREPDVYDEGLVLTAAMRVAAGQIPHRDFYANYGPAQFYVLAGLFKVFGQSVFVERLYDLLIKALLVASLYALALAYCRRWVAAVTATVAVLWIFSFFELTGTSVIPVGLLNLAGVGLIVPAWLGGVSTRRMFAAGAVAGLATLFRYDTGLALLGIEVSVIAIYLWDSKGLRVFFSALWPCLLAFVAVTLPCALYYLSVAPLHSLVFDIVLFPARYYRRGRNLPFPGISLRHLDHVEVYLLMIVIALSLYIVATRRGRSALGCEDDRWRGFLVAFTVLAFVMYFKGYVRMANAQLYLCILPSLLLIAVLFERRLAFSRLVRVVVVGVAWLSAAAAVWSAFHEVRRLQVYDLSLPQGIFESVTGNVSDLEAAWCKLSNPLTRGMCFQADDERIQAIEYIDSHTTPDQRLYIGLTSHDRIFVNDNLTYFGAQRLPATMWSHFDPGLQNSYEIQAQMVRELEASAPPYIVLDAEWDEMREPNDSSLSSGVTLLDDYLHRTYRVVEDYGMLSIWERVR